MTGFDCASRSISYALIQARACLGRVALVSALPAGVASAETTVRWEASSGLLPDQENPAWILTDTASPEDPVLGPTALTLATDPDNELMTYRQIEPAISIPDNLVIEARLRVLSSSHSSASKRAADIIFTQSPEFGNGLFIGVDEIFLLVANAMKDVSAFVDTDDAFHTYRLEVDGVGNISVFYDNVLTLSGSSWSGPANGQTPRVAWE